MQYSAATWFEIELRSANQRRHWSPTSQPFAPAEVLLEYLANGWKLSSVAGRAEHWFGIGRRSDIYYFELTCDYRMMVMPVQGNPAVHRLVWERQLRIVPLSNDDRLSEGQASEVYPVPRAEVEHGAAAARGRQDSPHGHGVKELAVSWHKQTSNHKKKIAQPLPPWVRQAREMEEYARKAEQRIRETAAEPGALKAKLIKLKAEKTVEESQIANEAMA